MSDIAAGSMSLVHLRLRNEGWEPQPVAGLTEHELMMQATAGTTA